MSCKFNVKDNSQHRCHTWGGVTELDEACCKVTFPPGASDHLGLKGILRVLKAGCPDDLSEETLRERSTG